MIDSKPVVEAIRMRLYSGRMIDAAHLHPEDVDIIDIAKALSMQCRYNGHCGDFYSVAEHSVIATGMAQQEGEDIAMQRAVLLHDATETYLADLPKPFKMILPAYAEMETKLDRVIRKKFNIDDGFHDRVKYYDNELLMLELNQFFPELNIKINNKFSNFTIHCMNPTDAEYLFLDTYRNLFD